MKKKDDSDELARLRAENESLYRRNMDLEARLADLMATSGEIKDEDKVMRIWHRVGRFERLLSSRYYSRYLIRLLKSTSYWSIYSRFLTYFRRYRFLSTAFRILTLIITWIETGAVFFFSISALVIILPVSLMLSMLTLMLALLRGRSANGKFASVTRGKKVYVLFGSRGQMKKDSSGFLRENAKALASDDGTICLVVSPFFFSEKGLGGKGAYVTGRCEGNNVYLLRKNYFFLLRRAVLSKKNIYNDVICIY